MLPVPSGSTLLHLNCDHCKIIHYRNKKKTSYKLENTTDNNKLKPFTKNKTQLFK